MMRRKELKNISKIASSLTTAEIFQREMKVLALGFLGLSSDKIIDKLTYEKIKVDTLSKVRGTVQADI